MTFSHTFHEPPALPIGETRWKPDAFQVAHDKAEIVLRPGYTYKGLGLMARFALEVETGHSAVLLDVVHLSTGHRIATVACMLNGKPCQRMDRALDMAAELADAADWSFDSLTAWKNSEPDLEAKCMAWHRKHYPLGQITTMEDSQAPDTAQRIAMSRWGNG